MRIAKTNQSLMVQAVAGTYVVVLGINYPKGKCAGLLGFSIHRQDHTENESYFLEGMKCFKDTDPHFPRGSKYPTDKHPIQDFLWGDYTAKPNHMYTYTVCALKGAPASLKEAAKTAVTVTTESPEANDHEVYFNSGVAGSQEFARRYGTKGFKKETMDPASPEFKWLSRGLYEALTNYITSCKPGVHSLKIAAYEFCYMPLLKVIKEAQKKINIKIVFDARKKDPKKKNRKYVKEIGLKCDERTEGASYISHNKFIVKLRNGKPESVWTGGTNFSENGIFGHSNVAHVFKDPKLAQKYSDYWDVLADDLDMKKSKAACETISPTPDVTKIPKGNTAIFSPRTNLDMLELYQQLALQAKDGLFMTFAFGIHELFKRVYETSSAELRFALLEKKTRSYKKSEAAAKKAEEDRIQAIRNMPENIFAIGNFIKTNKFDGWLVEGLTNLSQNVRYVHNKFMLVDPLSKDPIVVTGSANFSDASTTKNDENMVIVRGSTRVADIYLGEFMRIWRHHAFRESLTFPEKDDPNYKYLKTGNWWGKYFQDNDNQARRRYFSGSAT